MEQLFKHLKTCAPGGKEMNTALSGIQAKMNTTENHMLLSMLSADNFRTLLNVEAVADEDGKDLCRDVVGRFFQVLTYEMLTPRYVTELIAGLSSTSGSLQQTLLAEALTLFEKDHSLLQRLFADGSSANLLVAVCKLITSYHPSVSKCASVFLTKIAAMPSGCSAIFGSKPVVAELHAVASKDETTRFRVLELVASLACISDDCLKGCVSEGFLKSLLDELNSRDVLAKLNCLEILSDMAIRSESCLHHLHSQGVVSNLNQMLNDAANDPDSRLVYSAVIKFFGSLARLYPEECENFPNFLTALFGLVINYSYLDPGQRLLAFDTLGLIGSTAKGKLMLKNYAQQMQAAMICFGRTIREGPLEMRQRHLEALHDILSVQNSAEATEEIVELQRQWFMWLSDQPMTLVFNVFKQSIPALHCAMGKVIKSLVQYAWAQKLMKEEPGFFEYLLDRNVHTSNDGLYLKFEIVQQLLRSPSIHDTFDQMQVHRLQKYVDEGPHYKRATTDIAYENL